MKNNFFQRTFTGALLVALIISLIFFSNLLFTALMLAIVLGCSHELHALINLKQPRLRNLSLITAALFFVLITAGGQHITSAATMAAAIMLVLFPVVVTALYNRGDDALDQSIRALIPSFYVALPLGLVPLFAGIIPAVPKQPVMILSLFLLIWINDTFAYLTGITIGRHRLFERISPKKSWEGAAGGLLFSLAGAWLLSFTTQLMNLPIWLGLAAVVVIFGIFGDLLESLLKRNSGVKDSGTLLPGHGGLLDRFDALLLAAPAAWLYLSIVLN